MSNENVLKNFADACIKCDLDKVKELISFVDDLNKPYDNGYYLRYSLVENDNNFEVAEYLLKQGADINAYKDLLHSAITAEVDAQIYESCDLGNAEKINPDTIKTDFLIKNGIDINIINDNGDTPLDIAIKYSHTKAIKKLRDLGAKISDPNKVTLQKVLFLEHIEWLINYSEFVFLYGAPHPIKSDGIKKTYPEFLISDYLIDNGIDINTLDQDGNTPLDVAIQGYHIKAIEKLKPLGAKVSNINKVKLQTYLLWETLLYLNKVLDESEFRYIKSFFKDFKLINITSTNIFRLCEKNKTILESNKEINSFMSDYLIESGIDINNFDGNKETPLDVAIKCYHTKAIEKLKSLGAKTYNELK